MLSASAKVVGALMVLSGFAVAATATPEQQCQAMRVKAAGRYAACQQAAQAKLQTKGHGDPIQYADLQAMVTRCRMKYTQTWKKLQRTRAVTGSSCIGPRFTDNGATVTDNLTGLQWEKKTSLDDVANLADLQDADNSYSWTTTGTTADGPAFTNFQSLLNSGTCFAGQCDWRLPTRDELQTILSQPYPCANGPCLDPVFGPTQDGRAEGYYWTGSTFAVAPSAAWLVSFYDGSVIVIDKIAPIHIRAVRGGL